MHDMTSTASTTRSNAVCRIRVLEPCYLQCKEFYDTIHVQYDMPTGAHAEARSRCTVVSGRVSRPALYVVNTEGHRSN